uniref:Uncharacterized protein n=1 Tax=mine drainage metagenome TaxID=410659 RepID=E6PZR4_9ZZZZ
MRKQSLSTHRVVFQFRCCCGLRKEENDLSDLLSLLYYPTPSTTCYEFFLKPLSCGANRATDSLSGSHLEASNPFLFRLVWFNLYGQRRSRKSL